MSAHPADTAQPGDAFRDENGVTWLRADDGSGYPWITSRRVEGDRWHNSGDARERTLTPLIPALTAEGVDIVAEWKKAAADRRAVADRLGVDCHIDAIIPAIRRLQVRAEDADAAAAALTEVGVPPGRDMTLADAIRTLADTPVDIPAPDASDASDPAQLRLAAAICDAAGTPGEANMTLHGAAEILRHRAARLDVDAADRALAEQIARQEYAGYRGGDVTVADWDSLSKVTPGRGCVIMDLFSGTGSSADDHLDHAPATASLDDVLLTDLKELVHRGSASEDRSQQRDLGPSEVGDPCLRKLAYKMMDEPKVNPYGDPLPSVVGTGAHAMLEEFARRENTRLGRVRWIPETRVTIRQGLAGTCDLYDIDTATVIDHKFPGTSSLSHYRSHGPSDVYRRQAHLYGRGYRNLGLPVERVAICFWPRGGQIRNTFLWSEPYSDEIVEETTARIDSVILMIHDFDVEHHPANYAWIPATSGGCFLCPYYAKNPIVPTQCDGTNVGASGIARLAP